MALTVHSTSCSASATWRSKKSGYVLQSFVYPPDADKDQWHDDGEKDLGPDIASLSVGGAATMSFRMKSKYFLPKNLTPDNYNPELPVQKGSQAWQLRITANEHFKAGRMAEYEAAKKDIFTFLNKDSEKKKKHAKTCLTLELKHGDMVVMHGAEIQKFWEVC